MRYITLILLLSLMSSCSKPNNGDRNLINELSKKWHSSYSITPSCDIYLTLKCKSDKVDENEIKSIFSSFFIKKDSNILRDSSYVYLNIYNKNNIFLYQLYYDINKKKIIKSYQDSY